MRVLIDPPTRCVDVTPSDSSDLSTTTAGSAGGAIPFARKLRVTANGNVKLTTTGGDVRTYTGLTAGQFIDWVGVSRVWATGTTASVEALY